MDKELPADDVQDASQEENLESLKSDAEAREADETVVSGASADQMDEEDSMPGDLSEMEQSTGDSEDGVSKDGVSEDESDTEESNKGNSNNRHTALIVGGMVLVLLLIVTGLFLPPISLGQRLGLGGDGTESAGESSDTEAIALTLDESARGVKTETVSQEAFLSGDAGDDWLTAAGAIPTNLTLASDVYAISYKNEQPVGSARILIPASAQPYQTLDLFGWDGQAWNFVPSVVDASGSSLDSAEGPLPQALALMQTAKPQEVAIGAELLPGQELPAAVFPYLTEVSAGTLTLAQEGRLLGDIVTVPTGGYDQYLRATNTGAVVDTVSLSSLLSDPAAQQRNIQELVERTNEAGLNGINLDYQGVDLAQRDAFSTFVSDLAATLDGEGLELVVSLETPLLANDGSWDTAGQDWQAIGRAADAVYALMPLEPTAYADSGEAEQVLEWASRQIDRSKLTAYLTINAVDAVGDARREVEGENALSNFGEIELVKGSTEIEPGESVEVALSGSAGDLEWDPDGMTYKYTYEQANQPHDVWLSSEAVLSHQSRLLDRYNVRGLAVRGLGYLAQADGYAAALNSYLGAGEAPQPESAAIVWVVEDETGGVLASSSGEDLSFEWAGSQDPGEYTVRADFAHGDSVSSLGALKLMVMFDEPTPEPKPEEEEAEEVAKAESTPRATTIQPANVDPGDADAVANTPANVRNGPGLSYGIIGGLQTGQKVALSGRNGDSTWFQIKMADESDGWVFGTLLTLNASFDTNSLAVIEVEPPAVASGGGGAPAPVIAPAAGGNFELGGQTHSLANPTLMNMAGMNWVKFQHKWGASDTPEGLAGRIQQAHGNGFKVLLSIPGANSYPSSIDFNGYVEFLRGVAALGPDAIEIWNEENIDFEWPAGQIDPASYVNNMLAPAYNAIKSANPNVMVIMGAPAPTGFNNVTNAWSDDRYMAGVAAAGGGNYMDCIGVHHNAGATSPSQVTGHPAGNDHYSWFFGPTLNMYYNAFGGARPVCFTELGYLSGQDFGGVPSRFSWASNTSVAQHAQWLAEAVSMAANSGKVRLVIIFNVDFTTWGDDPQAGYAMLRPDGSCPSCSLLGQVMGR